MQISEIVLPASPKNLTTKRASETRLKVDPVPLQGEIRYDHFSIAKFSKDHVIDIFVAWNLVDSSCFQPTASQCCFNGQLVSIIQAGMKRHCDKATTGYSLMGSPRV